MTATLTPAAARMRDFRRRQREGLVLVSVELPGELLERMIDNKLLPERAAEDPQAIAAAVVEVVRRNVTSRA